MTTECPYCGFDDAYYDLDSYYCPMCERRFSKAPRIKTNIRKYMLF